MYMLCTSDYKSCFIIAVLELAYYNELFGIRGHLIMRMTAYGDDRASMNKVRS
jgi:hypothetical protein